MLRHTGPENLELDEQTMKAPAILDIAREAKAAAAVIASSSGAQRSEAIQNMCRELSASREEIMSANEEDVRAARGEGLEEHLIKRLQISEKVFAYMLRRLQEVVALPDPVNVVLEGHTNDAGLRVEKISVPIGVIGIIYEARPNVTTDAASVCLKSGNAVILRGGSECHKTNLLLCELMAKAAAEAGLPGASIQGIPTSDRAAVGELLKLNQYIDVLIPRGGKTLIERITAESRIPVIKHYDGICHIYIAEDADTRMAVEVSVNSKCERVEVCNALETLLVDAAAAPRVLPAIAEAFAAEGVELRGCNESRAIAQMNEATEEDWATEYLAPILSVRVVNGIDEAIEHIRKYGSGHTDGIITSSRRLEDIFTRQVDSASVMVNASTRLSGGGDYGMGAVVGISTDKLHARGPVGPRELTTYKWIARGTGHLRK